jgi:signal peptidase I
MNFDLFPQLLAQTQPSGPLQFVDSLARTPLSQVTIFVAVCTLIRMLIFPKLVGTAQHQRFGASYGGIKFLNEAMDAVIYAGVIVFLVIRPFVLQTFYIPSGSMLNTLQLNDFIVANKAVYRFSEPKAGEIVVFRPPERGKIPGTGDTDYIKRLIGTPGQVIEIKGGKLYRDGQMVNEPYVTNRMSDRDGTLLPVEAKYDWKLVKDGDTYLPLQIRDGRYVNSDPEFTCQEYMVDPVDDAENARLLALPAEKIPAGYYLMVGDNRNGSFDGRAWGLVDRKNIVGRSEFIWMPIKRMGATK